MTFNCTEAVGEIESNTKIVVANETGKSITDYESANNLQILRQAQTYRLMNNINYSYYKGFHTRSEFKYKNKYINIFSKILKNHGSRMKFYSTQ